MPDENGENRDKPQSGLPVSGLRFDPATSRIRSRSVSNPSIEFEHIPSILIFPPAFHLSFHPLFIFVHIQHSTWRIILKADLRNNVCEGED
jgi:hypothetical protein